MEISLSTPGLLFSAISLLLLAYSNRFLTIAGIMRSMRSKLKNEEDDPLVLQQIETLHLRINLIKYMQAFGVGSLLLAVITMTLLFFNQILIGKIVFGGSLLLMVISLILSLREIMMSGDALKIELSRISHNHQSTEE